MRKRLLIPSRCPHYAFFVLISCCSVTGISVALYFSCGGIFYTPVSEYFGVGRGTYAISGTIMSVTLGIFSPIMGNWVEKHSLRRILILFLIIQSSVYIAQSMFTSIYYFYISGAIHGIVHSLMMLLVVPTVINRWFSVRRGFFIGLASSMSGVGGVLWNAVSGPFMEAFGWRDTFLLYGILIALIPLPLAILVLRDYPEEKGLLPYGYEPDLWTENLLSPDDALLQGIPYETAKRTFSFWSLALLAILVSVFTCFTSYLPSYATSLGLSISFGAALASFMGIGILVGKNSTGILFDKKPFIGLLVSTMTPACGFLLFLILGRIAPMLMPVASVLYGVSYSVNTVLLPLLILFVFGARDQARILGSISFFSSTIGAGATVGFGFISDLPDGIGFFIILFICFLASIGSFVCGFLALRTGHHLKAAEN